MSHSRVVSDPAVMTGKPVIRGTRITVEHVLRLLGDGLSAEKVIEMHPHLTQEDLLAAQKFAADYLARDEFAFD